MNEIEASGKIKYRIANEMRKYGENKEEYEDLEIAIQALKEIREYRAIGTPTQIYEKIGGLDVELGKYHSIGTVEELKALKMENAELHCELQSINATMDLFEKEIRAKAIDEFAERMKELIYKWIEKGVIAIGCIDEIAEQMKGGATDEC